MTAREPLVSINVPCYRQLHLTRLALESIRAQSFANLEITLLDDGASDEYRAYVEALGDPRVRYRRNPERLGAMRNMFAAIEMGGGQYTMAFHEDDLLSASYIETAVNILDSHPACAFVASELREFDVEPSSVELARLTRHPAYDMFTSGADLVRGILRGIEPMFGSVVYRRAALADAHADHDLFATLVDRPYLLSIMSHGWSSAVVREPMVWYRHHGEGDTRHLAMTTDHVLQLLSAYRQLLPAQWNKQDQTLFFSYSGYWLFELYRLTPPEDRPPVWRFLFRAWREGLYNPRARGRLGLRQIQRALLNQTS
jgi:glycosyltransferase involved in cell wall biosynthesis